MAKYSDHSTIGGQVLAHRIRMIKQNANIIFIAGKIGFVLCFFVYFFINYSLYDLWNYFCLLKAGLSKNWSFFDGVYIADNTWNFTYMRDFVIRQLPDTAYAKVEMKAFFLKDLWIIRDNLKEKFITQFGYLKPLINNHQKVTLSRYTKGNGNILMFMPCNENPDLIKITNMLKTLAKNMNVYIVEDMQDIKND